MNISLHHVFVFLTAVFLGALFVLWLYDDWRDRRHEWHASEDRLAECPRCRLAFLFASHETVVRCPRCNMLCQSKRRGEAGTRRTA